MKRYVIVALLLGCAGDVDVKSNPGDATAPPTGEACPMPNVGAAPRECATSADCAWSTCSSSRCENGACAHDVIPDGSACFLDLDLYVGTCDACRCVIET